MPWSGNPNAPQISYWVHLRERNYFTGDFIGAILYGIVMSARQSFISADLVCFPVGPVISLHFFLECIGALLNPVNRMSKRARFGLAIHTTVIISLATVGFVAECNRESVSFIDNREFSGEDGSSPGPMGITDNATIIAPLVVAFPLRQWLADGLLVSSVSSLITTHHFTLPVPQLYRCWIMYSMNYWVIACSSLVYFASIGGSQIPLQAGHNVNN